MIETKIKLNLNEMCTVTLTEYGANILNKDERQYRSVLDQRTQLIIPEYKAGDKITMPLWHIMQTFGGDRIFMGMREVPFVDNVATFG